MANKTKSNTTSKQIQNIATSAGLLLMTAAATTLMLEVPDHPDKRAILTPQPAFAAPGQIAEQEMPGSSMRREREETGAHYVSYSVMQRTPGRTGKI